MVKWSDWVDWVMHQDSGELYTPIPDMQARHDLSTLDTDRVNAIVSEAEQNDSPIQFHGYKTPGTASGDRWDAYWNGGLPTTIREAKRR